MDSRAASGGEQHQARRMALAVELDRELYGKKPFALTPLQKQLQVTFNLFGMMVGLIGLRLAPTQIANGLIARFTLIKSKRPPPEMDAASRENVDKIQRLTHHSENILRRKPAVFFITSHPETSNEEAYRLGDLIFHAVKTSGRCFPKRYLTILQAIDPFALDTLPWWMGGAYAGLVYSGLVAVDRMPGSGSWMQNQLFRRAHFKRAIFNVLRALRRGNPFCAALGGGVIHNGRILYVFREFAQRIFRASPNRPFSKRDCELRVESILAADRCSAAIAGTLSPEQTADLLKLMETSGISRQDSENLLRDLTDELGLQTPYRLRFLRVVIRRVCGRGVPLLLAPLLDVKSGAICVRRPVLISNYERSNDTVRVIAWQDGEARDTSEGLDAFIKKFVREELNDL